MAMNTDIEKVKVTIERPEKLIGIIRIESVVLLNKGGTEIKDEQDLIDNSEYHSKDEMKADIAKRLKIDESLIEIIDYLDN